MLTLLLTLTAAVMFSNTLSIFALACISPFIAAFRCLFGYSGRESLLTCENVWMNHKQKRRDERLHRRSFFRTSKAQRFSQQPVGLRRDGAVISWQREAGHVGTARLTSKPSRPRESWRHTHAFCLCEKCPSEKKWKWSPALGLIAGRYESNVKEAETTESLSQMSCKGKAPTVYITFSFDVFFVNFQVVWSRLVHAASEEAGSGYSWIYWQNL